MAVCSRFEHWISSMSVPCTPLMLCCLTKRFTLAMPLAISRGMLLSTCMEFSGCENNLRELYNPVHGLHLLRCSMDGRVQQMIAQCKVMEPCKRDSNAIAESEDVSTGEISHLFLSLGAAGAYLGDNGVSLILGAPQLLAFVIQGIALRLQALLFQLSLLQRALLLPQLLLVVPNLLRQPSADSACSTCAIGTSMTSLQEDGHETGFMWHAC